MKKTTTLFMKITLALFLVFSTSNILKAQENVNIIDLQDLIGEGLSDAVYPTDMIEFDGWLYIAMADEQGSGASETELIRFDGTNAEIVDLGSYELGSFAYLCVHNNKLYFRLGNNQLGEYDGTTCTEIDLINMNSSFEVTDPPYPGHMCSYNGDLYFKIEAYKQQPVREGEGEYGRTLAKYDGTNVTIFDMSINEDLDWDCHPTSLTVFNNLLYFSSLTGLDDDKKEVVMNLTSFNGDETAEIIPFNDPENFMLGHKAYLCVYGGNLYMRTSDAEEVETRAGDYTLGKYDGINPVSIVDLNEINPQIAESNYPGHMAVHNNMMYFKTEDTEYNRVLASYDGNNAIIHDLSLLDPSIAYDLKPSAITSYQGNLYFRGETANGDKASYTQLIQYETSQPIPIKNWGILLGVLLITTLIVIRLFKR